MKKLLIICFLQIMARAAVSVTVRGTTSTQAVLSYTLSAPTGAACPVEVSESPSFTPLVHDTDPALFPGANLDNRSGSLGGKNYRAFIAGTRGAAQVGADQRRYSRALAAATLHYFRINGDSSCDSGGPVTGSFTTASIPAGRTYNDWIPSDPNNPGVAAWPSQAGSTPLVDPQTGLVTVPIQVPGDQPASSGTGVAFQAPYDASGNWGNCTALPCSYSGTGQGKLVLPIFINTQLNPNFEYISYGFLAYVFAHVTGTADASRVVNFCLMAGGVCQSNTLTSVFGTGSKVYDIGGNTPGMTDWTADPQFNQHLIARRSGSVSVAGQVITGPAGSFAPPYGANTPITLNGTGCSNQVFAIANTNTDSDSQLTLSSAPGCSGATYTLTPFSLAIWAAANTAQTINITAANFDYEIDYEAVTDSSPMQLAANSTGGPPITVGSCVGYLAMHEQGTYWESPQCKTRNFLGMWTIPYGVAGNPATALPQAPLSGGATVYDPSNAGVVTVAIPAFNGETAVVKVTYTGNYAQVAGGTVPPKCNGSNAPCLTFTALETSLNAKMAAYSSEYKNDCCGQGWTVAGGCPDGTLMLQNQLAGQQGVAGWLAVYDPASTSMKAARRTTDYYPMGGAFAFHSVMPRCAVTGGKRYVGFGAQGDWLGNFQTSTANFSGTDTLPTVGPYLTKLPAGLPNTGTSGCPSYTSSVIAAADWPGGANNRGTTCSSITLTAPSWEDPSPYAANLNVTVANGSTAITTSGTFQRQYAGKPIVIGGTTYTLASWTDTGHMTLSAPFSGSACASSCTGTVQVEPPASFSGAPAYNNSDFVLRPIRTGDVAFVSYPTAGVSASGGGNNFLHVASEAVWFLMVGKDCSGNVNALSACVQRNYGGTKTAGNWPAPAYLAMDINEYNFFVNDGAHDWDLAWNTTDDPDGSLGLGILDENDEAGHGFRGSGLSTVFDSTSGCKNGANNWAGAFNRSCYQTRYGANFGYMTAPFKQLPMTAPFSGILGNGSPNNVDTHASWDFSTAPQRIADARPVDAADGPSTGTRVATTPPGTLFKWTYAQRKFPSAAAAILADKVMPTQAWCGTHPLLNVSGPSAVIGGTSADAYKYVTVVAANEGVPGSAPGDLYVNCPGASIIGANDPGVAFNGGNVIDITVAPGGPWAQGLMDADVTADNGSSAAPLRWLGHAFSHPRWYSVFWSSRFTPDGRALLNQVVGMDNSKTLTVMSILPPFVKDSVNGSDFVPIKLTLTAPAGLSVDNAIVEFGYAENGSVTAGPFCTPRAEACVKGSQAGNLFNFETTESASYSGQPCSSACTIAVPAISQRVLYYRVKFRTGTAVKFTAPMETIPVP
jgi:hypothetical protein